MADVQTKFGFPGLRVTYNAAEALVGGQIAEHRAGTRIVGVAGAASNKVAGVVLNDVPVARKSVSGLQVGDGMEAVVVTDCVISVVASGAVNEGDRLITAAAGKAAAAGATPDARQVIGHALQAAADGATFLARIVA